MYDARNTQKSRFRNIVIYYRRSGLTISNSENLPIINSFTRSKPFFGHEDIDSCRMSC